MTPSPIRLKLAACLIALAALGCNQSSDEGSPALSARFEIQASDIARVEWVVSGGGLTDPIAGLAEVIGGTTPTVALSIMDLPVATGYGIVLTAYDSANTNICRGSAPFDIAEGVTTNIAIVMTCSVSSTLPSGSVGVDVTFQDNVCPVLNQINVVPQTIAVGQTTLVSVNANDPEGATLQYTWSSLAGTFANATLASTTYQCNQALDHNISINVSDGDTFCDQTRLLNVTCVPDVCVGPPALNCDDFNQCTDDAACDPVSGCPGSTPSLSGTVCDFVAVGDGLCDGAGACVECLAPTDCTDDGNECTAPATCPAGACVVVNEPASTPCASGVCDGAGNCTGCVLDTDCTDDSNECTAPVTCNAGTCVIANEPASTPCTGGVCNGSGLCVECVGAGDCTDDGNDCTTGPSCTAGSCDIPTNLGSGTVCAGGICNGAGACVGCVTAGDCTDDGNQCTAAPTCTASVCDPQSPLSAGTLCTLVTPNDAVCNGSGTCVECNVAGDCIDDGNDCTTAPSCTANVCDAQTPLPLSTPCDNGGGPASGTCDGAGICL